VGANEDVDVTLADGIEDFLLIGAGAEAAHHLHGDRDNRPFAREMC
jgi:hypothetical protein